jgi:single-stranded-DNA-specific exonuclease
MAAGGASRWLLPEQDAGGIASLARAAGVARPAAAVAWNRGYRDLESLRRFLRPTLDDLHDPRRLAGMDRAVERLARAAATGEKILLYGDYDVDGTSAIVILLKALELAGARGFGFHVPHRLRDGYGMRSEVIERAAAEGVGLIVSVDTGIRAADVVRRARELGIDVVVTDHHLPDAELPPAVAVLNPNAPGCGYPNKNLCGAGVAFKLAQALLGTLGWERAKTRRVVESLLKMVAIATVADVVPLIGENRTIVKHGLEGLESVRNPGLRALLDVAGFSEGERPSAEQVAFRVAPRINAAGRMASAEDVIHLFLTPDADRARQIAGALHGLNQDRQQVEAGTLEAILERVLAEPVTDAQAGLVFAGDDWHRGVVGIVASRVVERFGRPAFVLSVDRAKGEAAGSGRSIAGFHLLDALESMAELFTRFGGHRQAAGVTMEIDRLAEFERRFNEYAAARLGPEDFLPKLEIDATVSLEEIGERAIADVFALAPFGHGNPLPVFAALGAETPEGAVVWKEKHLMLKARQGVRSFLMRAWNAADRAAEIPRGARVDVAFAIEEDRFAASRGLPGWTLALRDFRTAS